MALRPRFRETIVTADRIASMAETKTAEEIADVLGIEESEVYAFLEKTGKPGRNKSVLVCNKTRRWLFFLSPLRSAALPVWNGPRRHTA